MELSSEKNNLLIKEQTDGLLISQNNKTFLARLKKPTSKWPK